MKKAIMIFLCALLVSACGAYRKNYDSSWHEYEPIGNGDRAYFHTLDCNACKHHHDKMKRQELRNAKKRK